MRRVSPPKTRSSPKAARMQAGTSASCSPQSQGRHSHTSTSFRFRMMGSTASTTAAGMLLRMGQMAPSELLAGDWDEKTLAVPSLPKRMARLSKTARPLISAGRGPPTMAAAVMR